MFLPLDATGSCCIMKQGHLVRSTVKGNYHHVARGTWMDCKGTLSHLGCKASQYPSCGVQLC